MGRFDQSILYKMGRRFFPKWPFFLLAIISCVGLAFVYLRVTKPVYKVTASIVVADKNKINTEKTALSEIDLEPGSKSVEIEMEVLHSRSLINKVLKSLNLYSKEGVKASADSALLIDQYQGMLEVTLLNQKSSIVALNIKDTDPKRGKAFLNRLISIYNAENDSTRSRKAKENLDFIESRLADLNGELKSAEENIEDYKSSRSMTDPSAESRIYMESLQQNDKERSQVGIKIAIIEGIERAISTPGNVPASIGIDDEGLKSSIERLAQLQQAKSKLLATTPESNHLFDPINEQIRQTTAEIKTTAANIKLSLNAMKNQYQRVNSKVESSIKSLPGQERGYISMKRQQAIKEDIYNYLLKKREEVGLNYYTVNSDPSLMDAAYVSAVVWPKKPIVYVFAIMFALILTASVIYLRELFSNTTLSSEEIEEALSTPVLSELSFVKTDQSIVAIGQGNTMISQQFRALRTNLYYVHGSRAKGRVTMISSSRSGEGKSFATSNLAISLALSGRKTVVVDMDLHKPVIASIFGLDPESTGVTDYLQGDFSADQILHNSSLAEKLYIITSGSAATNPSELIESERLNELISELKEQFDDIVLDTPPLHMVTDAYILSQYSDASLYVIRKGITKKTELDFIQRLFSEQRLPKLNLIFNGAAEVVGAGY